MQLRNPGAMSEPLTKRKPYQTSEPRNKRNPFSRSEPATRSAGVHPRLEKLSNSMPALVDAALAIEKLRVASEVRQSHLARQGKSDTETNELHRRLVDLENYVDDRVAALLKTHPAYPWFSRVKGVGEENISKVIGLLDIEKADTISSLWKFAGFAPVDGKAEKRQKGVKLHYNSPLRSMCWRLANSLLRTRGKFYEYYLKEKDKYQQRFQNEGRHIVPVTQLPKKDGKRYEPADMIAKGHLHNMALRKMIKLFLSLLWVVWREAEGLSTRAPYPVEYLGHDHMIEPEELCDEPEPL